MDEHMLKLYCSPMTFPSRVFGDFPIMRVDRGDDRSSLHEIWSCTYDGHDFHGSVQDNLLSYFRQLSDALQLQSTDGEEESFGILNSTISIMKSRMFCNAGRLLLWNTPIPFRRVSLIFDETSCGLSIIVSLPC